MLYACTVIEARRVSEGEATSCYYFGKFNDDAKRKIMPMKSTTVSIIYWIQILSVLGALALVLAWGFKQEVAYELWAAVLGVIFLLATAYAIYSGNSHCP